MNNKTNEIAEDASSIANINDVNQLKSEVINDFNELLDIDIKVQEISKTLISIEEDGDYYGWYKIIKEFLSSWSNIKDFHKAFLYEKLGDFIWELGDYPATLDAYNESKKYWNKFVYEKILNLYTSFSLVDETSNFSEDNNIESLLWECQNACEYNLDAYADYWYYTYLYKQDLENAKKILKEWIEKWSKISLFKYIELNKDLFLLELWNIENEKDKFTYIKKNKQDIINAYKDAIDLWETKLIWDLATFYEEIWFYINAKESYESHIKINKDYTFYKNLWDLLFSDNILLMENEKKYIEAIDAYKNLYEISLMKRDPENYTYWLKKLSEVYEKIWNIKESIIYLNSLYIYVNWNNLIEEKEEILLRLLKLANWDENIYLYAISELININNKYLLLEAAYYEDKDLNRSLSLYLEAYYFNINDSSEGEWIYDSGNALGIFLYSLSLNKTIQDNKKFLEDMAEKAYNYDKILDIEIATIRELLK